MDAGCSMMDAGCWILDTGCGKLDAGCWMLDTRCWMRETGKLGGTWAVRLKSEERSLFLHSSIVNQHLTFQSYSVLGLRSSAIGVWIQSEIRNRLYPSIADCDSSNICHLLSDLCHLSSDLCIFTEPWAFIPETWTFIPETWNPTPETFRLHRKRHIWQPGGLV